ncbi:MAG: acyl-CoA carboxylase subunit beta [Gammaproteobacteria bacterium]|nr:MAG: acyl-CoA carboxylase subunit beta [Gammaproteobacteria bacterium]
MAVIQSKVNPQSDSFRKNRSDLLELIEQINELEGRVHVASNRKRELFKKRGQLLPRDRLALMVDPGASFIELSTLAGLGQHDDDGEENVFGAGIIVGIGFVEGTRCIIYLNDAAIKGGTNMPQSYDKLKRAQEIASEAKLPFICLVQSGGGNLFLQHLGFNRAGHRFMTQAQSSAAGIPQITVVHGASTAGGAYIPGMSDYVIMVKGQARAYLAGPPLLKAATGEIAEEEALGGAEMHARESGLAEYLAEDDAHAIEMTREVVKSLNWNDRMPQHHGKSFKEPRYDIDELCGIVPIDYRKPYDCREVIARLIDDSDFVEFKSSYDPFTICGYAEIEGQPCGLIGNNGPITNKGAGKATQFIQLCCQAGKPIIFLQNTTGFIVGAQHEQEGMIKNGAKLIQAVSNATVPRITLNIGGAFGAGNYAMSGRSFEPDFLFAWPTNTLSVMGGEQAAMVMSIVYENKQKAKKEPVDEVLMEKQTKKIVDYYTGVSSALYCTSRVWDEGIIDPRKSRRLLAELLDISMRGDQTRLDSNTFGIARI